MKYLILTILFVFANIQIASAQIPEKPEDISPLLISEKVPAVEVVTTDGESIKISEILLGKRTILLFYRGGWCPYCNTHLSEVGLAESEIMELGYQVVALSPDSPEKLKLTVEKGDFKYSLFSDANGSLMKAMGIAFKAPERYSNRLFDFSDGLNNGLLPVPSLFVIDEDGTILFEYISPDYRQRIGADFLVEALKQINKEKELK